MVKHGFFYCLKRFLININDIPNRFILLTFSALMIQQKQNKDSLELI